MGMYVGKKKVTPILTKSGLDALQWKCDNMKTLYQEFRNYKGTSLDEPLNVIDTGNVTDMSYMFQACSNITSIPQINTSSVTTMAYMFSNCTKLTAIPLLNTGNVVNMLYMFNYCYNLTTIPELNTSKATSMNYMFYNCSNLTSIPLLDTSKVINMSNMFTKCSSLITIPELNTSNVTNMSSMFGACTNLTSIPKLDTSKVTSMSSMFNNCPNLTTVSELNMINADSGSMFTGDTNLTNLTLKNIKRTLYIGSTNWGKLLTVDSIVNTIKELWDNSSITSTYTLGMGSANLTKIADVYVKLITPTQEQIEADPHINNKKPCEVCESTDEGAMLIEEYAISKKWKLV